MTIGGTKRRWRRSLTRGASLFAATMLALSVWVTVDGDASRAGASPTASGQALVVHPDTGDRLNSGGKGTVFDLALPGGAACPGDSANGGWLVTSYLVSRGTDLASLVFDSTGPVDQQFGAGSFRQPLYATDTAPFVDGQTANASPPAVEGAILLPPVGTEGFSFAVFGDPGSGFEIPPGEYDMGIACVQQTGQPTYPIDRYWNALLTVGYDAENVMTWSVEQPVDTALVLSADPDGSAEVGQGVTLTASLAPEEATGVVSFTWEECPCLAVTGAEPTTTTTALEPTTTTSIPGLDGESEPVAVIDGIAMFTLPPLSAGSYMLRAWFYSGEPNSYRSAAAESLPYTIRAEGEAIPTTTILAVTPDLRAPEGAEVTLNATVTPAGVAGTLVFLDGTTPIPGPIGANTSAGTYTLPTTALPLGPHSLKAVFTPDDAATFHPSESLAVPYDITAPTGVTVSATPASPAAVGASVTFTATVTPGAAAGTVQFKDGALDLGAAQTVTGGVATLSTAALTAGDHAISATFTPSDPAAYSTSTSPPFPFTVGSGPAATTVTLTASPSGDAEEGEEVTFTATVAPSAAAGTVVLKDGTTTIGSAATVVNGKATFEIDDLDVDEYSLKATFTPTSAAAYQPSTSAALAYEITEADDDDGGGDDDEAAATTVTLTITPAEPRAGDRVTLTATVSPAADGTVTFSDGTEVLGTDALEPTAAAAAVGDELKAKAVGSSTATFIVESLAPGEHSFTASFTPTDADAFVPASTASPMTITAATIDTPVTQTAEAGGTPSSSVVPGTLPFTGGGLAIAFWGLVLLVFGRMAVLVGRRPDLSDGSP